MLSAIMLSVIMLNVTYKPYILSVAPWWNTLTVLNQRVWFLQIRKSPFHSLQLSFEIFWVKWNVRKDDLLIKNQVYYRRLFTNVQNITTLYKHIYI